MTLSLQTTKIQYSGNDVTVSFPIPFYFLADSHILAIITDEDGLDTTQVLTTNYSLTGEGDLSGGNLTMVTAPATGETLTIMRVVPITQLIDYIANDSFPAETHEIGLDKLTMICQAMSETLERAIKFPSSAASTELSVTPTAVLRANSFLMFDSLGNVAVLSLESLLAQIGALSIVSGTSITLGAPSGTSSLQTVTVDVDSSGLFLPIRAWFVDSSATTPTFLESINPPSGHPTNLIKSVTDTNGDATLSIVHTGAIESWKLVVEVGGILLLSSTITMGS